MSLNGLWRKSPRTFHWQKLGVAKYPWDKYEINMREEKGIIRELCELCAAAAVCGEEPRCCRTVLQCPSFSVHMHVSVNQRWPSSKCRALWLRTLHSKRFFPLASFPVCYWGNFNQLIKSNSVFKPGLTLWPLCSSTVERRFHARLDCLHSLAGLICQDV